VKRIHVALAERVRPKLTAISLFERLSRVVGQRLKQVVLKFEDPCLLPSLPLLGHLRVAVRAAEPDAMPTRRQDLSGNHIVAGLHANNLNL